MSAAARPALTKENDSNWKDVVAPYVGAHVGRSIFQLVSTAALLALAFVLIYKTLDWSLLAALALSLPAAGLLVRTFIIMHDCGHGSFLPSRRVSDAIGFVAGTFTLTPYAQWRRDHALHHASAGDLDRRGHGDVPTLTVREYLAKSPREQLKYRLIRHPLTLLFLGPIHLAVGQRMRPRGTATGSMQVTSVWGTNVAIVLFAAAAVWLWGWKALLLVYLPAYYFAAMAGVWLFYVQHQFEDAYWEEHGEWDYAAAALRGSSHLRLPAVLQWFTGNIGLHHVHHLAPRIPNYSLQRCHDASPLMQTAPVVTMRSGLSALRLALWDEDARRLVRFTDISATGASAPLAAPTSTH